VTVQTDKSQALIGFVGENEKPLKNLSAQVENDFCAIILTCLDGKPISGSEKLLLTATARSANTAMKWNDKKTSLVDWGSAPTVIEPVKGHVTLENLKPHKKFEVIALDGAGKSLAKPIEAQTSPKGVRIAIGEPPTAWYLINITRWKTAYSE
jgi:hypothetical protein